MRVGTAEALLLGPVAVHPTRQGEGLGGALIREGMARAEADRWPRVLLVGDAPYYRRFGFRRLAGVEMPAADQPGAGSGLWRVGRRVGPRHAMGALSLPLHLSKNTQSDAGPTLNRCV